MEERRGMTIKGLLVRLILIIIFIFLLIWLFPMPDLKPLNNQIFSDNLDRMKDVAKSYYTVERLPKNVNDSKRMTLQEMIDNHLIMPLMDSNGKYCSTKSSYIEITKLEDEYVIKVYLSCSDKQDYIIEHFGCYDICSNTCKLLETTTTKEAEKARCEIGTTKYKTTYYSKRYTSATSARKTTYTTLTSKYTTDPIAKIYEYEYVKNICVQEFDKYVCPTGWDLVGENCIKDTARVVTEKAVETTTEVITPDTKPAKEKTVPVDENGNVIDDGSATSGSGELVDAVCAPKYVTSTEDAKYNEETINATKKTTTSKVTADAAITTITKPAYASYDKVYANYLSAGTYDIVSASKVATSSKWVYDYTLTSASSNLAYTNENEKLVYVSAFEEEECPTCSTSHTTKKYSYWHFTKQYTYSYTCPSGYSKYSESTCISNTATGSKTTCPSGYKPDGDRCSKTTAYYDSKEACKAYGSDYTLNKEAGTCTKKSVTGYSCPKGTPTDGGKNCLITKVEYSCPAGWNATSDTTKCSKRTYYCPDDTSARTYTLNGSKCTLKKLVNACTCPEGTVKSSTVGKCIKTRTKTIYTCEDYPGYELRDTNKCVKEIKTTTTVLSCDKYGSDYVLNEAEKTCLKTISERDTKAAEKTYKPICEQHYMWSTKTSVEGWSYTGNKRVIN
jgi:hypothetical protein